jgi:hypothetical protein
MGSWKKVTTLLGLSLATISFAGGIYAQGTKFGQLIKISFKGEGKEKVYEGYLELPSGEIWKFNTLSGEAVRNLTAFVSVDYVQPEKEEPAFKGATTPYNAVKFTPLRKFHLKKVYTLPIERVRKFIEEGYNYSRGFRCGRVQDISIKEFKTGWFSHKKAMQIHLALTNIYGLPAVDQKGQPIVWKAIIPSNQNKEGFFETFEEGKREDLYNVLLTRMGKFVCIEYIQREPNPEDPFNYRVIGVFEVSR